MLRALFLSFVLALPALPQTILLRNARDIDGIRPEAVLADILTEADRIATVGDAQPRLWSQCHVEPEQGGRAGKRSTEEGEAYLPKASVVNIAQILTVARRRWWSVSAS